MNEFFYKVALVINHDIYIQKKIDVNTYKSVEKKIIASLKGINK